MYIMSIIIIVFIRSMNMHCLVSSCADVSMARLRGTIVIIVFIRSMNMHCLVSSCADVSMARLRSTIIIIVFIRSMNIHCLVSSCTDVGMSRLHSTLLTVAHRSPMLLAGSVSGRPQQMMVVPQHRLSTVGRRAFTVQGPRSGTPCQTTSAHSRTMSPLDNA